MVEIRDSRVVAIARYVVDNGCLQSGVYFLRLSQVEDPLQSALYGREYERLAAVSGMIGHPILILRGTTPLDEPAFIRKKFRTDFPYFMSDGEARDRVSNPESYSLQTIIVQPDGVKVQETWGVQQTQYTAEFHRYGDIEVDPLRMDEG